MGKAVAGMKGYPKVANEWDTLRKVLDGYSIARFGDGEFKIASGGQCVSQERSPELSRELARILVHGGPRCLVGIPTMDPEGPKYGNWAKYREIYARQVGSIPYFSAFISRPDSARAEANCAEYFDLLETLWRGEEVTLVGCGERSLTPEFLVSTGAKNVSFVRCPRRDAYRDIEVIEEQVVERGLKRVLLCAGPTATCLAVRLSEKGFHAIDLGHIGMFWRAYANPKSHLYRGPK